MIRFALAFLFGVLVGVLWYRTHWMAQDAVLVLRDVNAYCEASHGGACVPARVAERVRASPGVWGAAPR